MSYKEAVRRKCIDCGTDPLLPGTALEQIADCPCVKCDLYPVRPLPRQCRRGGVIDTAAIEAISAKLRAIDARWAKEGR